MMNEIAPLDRKGLRRFGLTTGVIILLLFAGFVPWLLDHAIPLWPWIFAAVLWLPALVAPMILQPVYTTWMKFGAVVGAFNTRLLLGIMFYIMITPIGIIKRLFGSDLLNRTLDDRSSYRIASKVSPTSKMEKPF